MGVTIGSHKRYVVYKKTNFRCSCCGSTQDLTCDHFIPQWTRIVGVNEQNLIPLCEECNNSKGYNFLPISSLKYLPKNEIDRLMLFYDDIKLYLKKYIVLYGKYRTDDKFDVERTLAILKSYDVYLEGL